MARQMVTKFGMSDLGLVSLENQNNDVFLGRDWMNKSEYSEDIAAKIDIAVREIVGNCYIQAKEILQENRLILERVVDLLIEQETIEGDVFRTIVADNTAIKIPKVINDSVVVGG
jgi:cell division protease FtsH